jgi:4-aminobutyrate aminotransferase
MSNSTFHFKAGTKAKAWVKRDEKVISPSYTRDYPFVMARGKGSEVWDIDGTRFLDFTSGIAVTSTGHSHPQVVKAITEQAKNFLHMSGTDFYYANQIELAEKLAKIVPIKQQTQVFFVNSGTEANEAAIKLARYATGRKQFIGFLHSFHGRSMGALAFTSSKAVQREGFFPMIPGVTHVPYPDTYRPVLSEAGFADYGERVASYIEKEILATIVPASEVAGILVEPIQGEGGYVVPTPGFFKALRRLCDKIGCLLIVDEVQTGMGRTGKWFGIEHFGVEPDIITVAKGIASGMPLGAMIAKKSLMKWVPGSHGNTFGGNPVSCAAALATLNVLEKEGVKNAATLGEYAMKRLLAMKEKYSCIGDVRGKGLLIGIDFVKDQESREPDKNLRDQIIHEAFNKRLLLLGCGPSTIRIVPPLTITKKHLDEGLDILEQVIKKMV